MAKNKVKIGKDGIYDARQLGGGRMVVLGIQHLFAMFGATVTVCRSRNTFIPLLNEV